jgi:hypothetical protein
VESPLAASFWCSAPGPSRQGLFALGRRGVSRFAARAVFLGRQDRVDFALEKQAENSGFSA